MISAAVISCSGFAAPMSRNGHALQVAQCVALLTTQGVRL